MVSYRKSHVKSRIHGIKPKKSVFKKPFFWFAVLFFVLISAAVYFFLFYSGIQIKNIIILGNQKVSAQNIKNLVFSLSTPADISLSTAQNINFTLTGPAQIVWKLDINKFTSDLLGQSKKDFSQILSQYPNIDSATLTVSPIWKMSIPSQTKDVKVIVNYPQ